MRTKLVLLLAAILVVLVLVGCGGPKVTSGEVVDKRYTPAHTDEEMYQISQVCVMVGKTMSCTPIYGWHDVYYGETWEITISDGKNKSTYYVSPKDFEQLRIGDYFDAA